LHIGFIALFLRALSCLFLVSFRLSDAVCDDAEIGKTQ